MSDPYTAQTLAIAARLDAEATAREAADEAEDARFDEANPVPADGVCPGCVGSGECLHSHGGDVISCGAACGTCLGTGLRP